MKKLFFLPILIAMVAGAAAPPAAALEIRSRDRVIALISDASMARTPMEFDRVLRSAAEEPSEPAPADSTAITDAYGVVWYDNWKPRARIWLKNIEAERLFRDILPDSFLLEAVDLEGLVNVELEIRSGNPATIRGRLLLRDADLRWKEGDFALRGVNGFLPFNRFIGQPEPFSGKSDHAVLEENNITIDTMVWSNRPIASHIEAAASYDNMILRFDRMNLKIMGGGGIGTVVMDHRGKHWKFASMVQFNDVDLNRLHELLPGLPLFARITMARLKGQLGILFESPDRIRLTGNMESMAPGIIELSPLMHQRVRSGLIDSRVIRFQRMTLELGEDNLGKPEARINLRRRTARNFSDLAHGMPLLPGVVQVRIPLLPFVQELSR